MSAVTLARPRVSPASDWTESGSLGLAVFPSRLGWIAMAGEGDMLIRLTFGHDSHDDAMAALAKDRAWWQSAGPSIVSMDWNHPLVRRLQAYAESGTEEFHDIAIDTSGLSDFQRRVVHHCRRIRAGKTRTYGELAALAGSPGGARAVGNVMAANCLPLIVPCHRVVAANGLGHYSAAGGRRTKLLLLEREAAAATERRSRPRPR